MIGLTPTETSDGHFYVMITGANSGIGISIAFRLIDELFASTSSWKHLTLILCTRSINRTRSIFLRLEKYVQRLQKISPSTEVDSNTDDTLRESKIFCDGKKSVKILLVEVDLCILVSVYSLADSLIHGTHLASVIDKNWIGQSKNYQVPRIDTLILLAGIGGWAGVNWLAAARDFCLDIIEATTWPKYKKANIGRLAQLQWKISPENLQLYLKTPRSHNYDKPEQPPLGEVFCANVFGHYILAHELMPLLSVPATPSSQHGGKIIWVSSVEAYDECFSIDDIQGIRSLAPYESSKRFIDLLVLGSNLPSVRRLTMPFFHVSKSVSDCQNRQAQDESGETKLAQPKNYLVHPGVFASNIMPLNFIFTAICKLIFYLVRWLGSPWHTIDPYRAANACIWLALEKIETLEEIEKNGSAKVKWGSATDAYGNEKIVKTEVPGWGWDGQSGASLDADKIKGRKKDSGTTSKESIETFESTSAQCWKQIEKLREEWETILDRKNNDIPINTSR